MSTKADVLRRIADAMDEGAPHPIGISVHLTPMRLLFGTERDWAAWAWIFKMPVMDAALDAAFMPEGVTSVSLTNEDIELVYHQVDES